jgi:prepilin-type N-terminal cleavage/methylation domain-containing protein
VRRGQEGFSLIEVLVTIMLLGLLAVLALQQQTTAQQVQATQQGLVRAQAVAQDILQQAQADGCGAVVGTEPAVQLAQLLAGCNWATLDQGVLLGNQARWSPPTEPRQTCQLPSNRGSAAAAQSGALQYLDSTPWFCQQQDGQWFTVQLRTDWVSLTGALQGGCGSSAPAPQLVLRTVQVMWMDQGQLRQHAWTTLAPVPPNSVATQVIGAADLQVDTPGPGPVEMLTAQGASIGQPQLGVVQWASGTGQAWFPFLPPGFSATVARPGGSPIYLPPASSSLVQCTTLGG